MSPKLKIDVQFDSRKAARIMNMLRRKQIPYATAVALTHTGSDVRDKTKEEFSQAYEVRSKWVVNQIIRTPARKKDGINRMNTTIGARGSNKTWFMRDQLKGTDTTRSPARARYRFIPKAARRNRKARIPKRLQPRQIMANPRAVIIERIPGSPALYLRMANGQLRLMYTMTKRQTIRPDISLEKIAEQVAPRVFPKHWGRAMARAIATAR